jgi:PAS domain S-box-containing protein
MADEPATVDKPLAALHAPTGSIAHVFDAIPDGIVLADGSGQIQLVNQQSEVLFGFSREELIGQPLETLMPERFRPAHPAHRARYFADPHVRPMGSGLQLFALRHDGTEFPVEISLSPVEIAGTPLVLATIRDVTEQRRLEHVARESLEARLALVQAMLDALPADAYLVRGHDARLVLANRRVAEIWGAEWPEGQPLGEFLAACGTRVCDLAGREQSIEELATVRALWTGESVYQQQEILRHRDGSTLPVLVNAVALDPRLFPYLSAADAPSSGPLPLALVVHQDVSALKDAERLKDEFIALAAHELRNPVATLSGYAQMLAPVARNGEPSSQPSRESAPSTRAKKRQKTREQGVPQEWRVEALSAVVEAANRLATLTDDLLDATRLHANQLALRPEPLELGALLRRVVRRQQVTTRLSRHPITVETPDAPAVVVADAQRVEQVLANLLSNAIKYSPQGGTVNVMLAVDSGLDDIAAAEAAGAEGAASNERGILRGVPAARVTVRDHGMGIPTEQQSHLFGRFVRAENARQAAIPGSGLGLYLCRELLERQGGRIWFKSVVGEGTTFAFELPLLTDVQDDDDEPGMA